MFERLGVPKDKYRMIRFGKVMEDFCEHGGWNGRLPIAYITCNSVERRGEGCGWSTLNSMMGDMGLPIILSGKETETLRRGIGELDYEGMKSMYRNARCFVSLGTQPAPLVLTQIEAMVTGCPVIVLDNGCGIADEGLPVIVLKKDYEVGAQVEEMCTYYHVASRQSRHAMTQVDEEFNMTKVAKRWEEFMVTMEVKS